MSNGRNSALVVFTLTFCCLRFPARSMAATDPSPSANPVGDWSDPLEGLQVRILADRAVYHPGERLALRAQARNAGDAGFMVRAYALLRMITPDGEHRIYRVSGGGRPNFLADNTVTLDGASACLRSVWAGTRPGETTKSQRG